MKKRQEISTNTNPEIKVNTQVKVIEPGDKFGFMGVVSWRDKHLARVNGVLIPVEQLAKT